ncbi:hypothetical protein SAMN05192588_1534 [Nonlabens sp. Hel1_33_55]|uniref:hypothetical protein n=1 Tax=Nonlabens sp. Hel1_33_55 TaxID=1336802 RepID=UPI000875E259|nr:hypothetical protein [Nonlabens sp. Hel1_33_55]SCY17981.1 hypothetical protein SAMN05192588_1534 [Nonlabens sp. Hel1_33_55]
MIIKSQNRRLFTILTIALGILLIPAIAMLFTTEVNWSAFDFIVMGFLLVSTGLALEFILRKVQTSRNRILLGVALLVALFLVWAELAVGIFGSPFAGS